MLHSLVHASNDPIQTAIRYNASVVWPAAPLVISVLMLHGSCLQFSPSPNGKVRDISDAKKRALAGNDIFNNNQVQQ